MDPKGMMPDGSYQMDHKTLMFIANQGARPQGGGQQIRPYRPNQGPPPGTCYNCGGDHWVRDCPNPKTKRPTFNGVPPLIRTCADCGIKHFVQDCPMKPENKAKVTLNYVEVCPITSSPGSSETEVVVPIQVITQAQAKEKIKENKENKTGQTPSVSSAKTRETWKARKARRAASKAKRNENEQAVEEKLPQTAEAQPNEPPKKQKTREEQPAGSVLVDKHFEPLDALLQAYEARLKPLETLEERWKNYLDPAQEARQLEIFKRLTEATQALEEKLRSASGHALQPPTRPNETTDGMDEIPIPTSAKIPNNIKINQEDGLLKDDLIPIFIPNSSIPEVDEDWGNKLWEAVKQTQQKTESHGTKPPLDEIDFDQKTLELEIRSENGDAGSEKYEESKAETMKTLPSYQGDYEANSEVQKIT